MSLKNKITIIERKKLGDSRGWFLKVIDGKEEGLPGYTGEIYLTHASGLDQVRGNHYHPKATEWFTLIADKPQTIVIPPNVAHAFVNTKEEPFLLLAYTDELYNPEDTIAVTLH